MAEKPDRKTYLGGSDAAGILGLSPWATPLDIYFRKVGYPGDPPPADPMREKIWKRGKRMEPVVIEMLRDEYPIEITKVSTEQEPNRYRDEEYPFMAAEIDFEWTVTRQMIEYFPKFKDLPLGSTQNGEVKTVHPFGAGEWGEATTDEIPVHYGCQSMHGLGVTKRLACLYALLIGSDNLIPYQIMNDPEIMGPMRKRLANFWLQHVIPKIAPSPVNLPDIYRMLRLKGDTEIQVNADVLKLIQELVIAKGQEKMAQEEIEDIQFKIGEQVLGAEAVAKKYVEKSHRLMLGKSTLLTIALQSRSSVDSGLLQKEWPEIHQQVVRSSNFFVYRLPRKRK